MFNVSSFDASNTFQTSWDRIKTGARKLPNAKKKPGKLLMCDRIMVVIEKRALIHRQGWAKLQQSIARIVPLTIHNIHPYIVPTSQKELL